MKKFQGKIVKTIEQYHMLDPGDHVIVAISGGPDSVALASALLDRRKRFDLKLTLAHFHHGVRPKEADDDLEFVKALAEKWGLPIEVGHARLGARRKNLEEVMRDRRYAFLERIRRKRNADRIAVGHNANDTAETLLINLLRGSGVTGLAGIPPVQGKIMRPLIQCERREILDHIKNKKLRYRTDSSNTDMKFLRNRIRHELMPQLAKYNPSVVSTLLRTAQSFHELDMFLSGFASDVFRSISKTGKDRVEISIPELLTLPQALRVMVLREAIRDKKGDLRRISRKHLLDMDSLASGSRPNASLSLPGKLNVIRRYEKLLLSGQVHTNEVAGTFEVPLAVPGKTSISFPGLGKAILTARMLKKFRGRSISPAPGKKSASMKKNIENDVALFDMDALPERLFLRQFRPGDRIRPFGMCGRRKLKDIFIEMRVPLDVRRNYPVMVSDGEVIWVPGYRIADLYKVTPFTNRALKISLRFES